MSARQILACSHDGISRATRTADGTWQVDRLDTTGKINCFVVDPNNPDRIYAGTPDGLIFSGDAGASWESHGPHGVPIKSVAVSPHDPNVIYAGGKPAVMYKSVDGGKTWRELESFRRIPNRWWWFSPAEPPDRRPYVFAISVSPTEPDTVLAGVEFGAVVRSDDGGKTWSRHRPGALRDCHSLKFHQTDGSWAYEAGGTGGGASFSRDGGHTWQKVKRGLAKNYGIVCAADPVKPEIWYACVAPSPFKAFTDGSQAYLYRAAGGAGWHPIGWQAHPINQTPTALVTVPGAGGHLYAGLYNGEVWHTADYGDTWEQLPFNLGSIWFSMVVR